MKLYKLLIAGLLGLSCAAQAQTSVSATVAGVLAPGVFGRVDVSNGVIPPLMFPQPMVIAAAPVAVQPVYMHVPPGHAKKWRKHCHKYNACGTPVYFVQANYAGSHSYPVQPVYYGEHKGKKHKKDKKDKHGDHDDGHGHSNGKHKN